MAKPMMGYHKMPGGHMMKDSEMPAHKVKGKTSVKPRRKGKSRRGR
jgi:hypothetical protein